MITHDVDEAVLLSDRIVMMTNGSAATVGNILKVEIERSRDRLQLAEQPKYNHYRAEVVRFLPERYSNPESESKAEEIHEVSEEAECEQPVLYAVNE